MPQQNKLEALSPAPESEARTSCEFDFSGLALPVPLEFADADSLQDVPLDVFDERTSPTLPLDLCDDDNDGEPAEVEVKPILADNRVHISVFVEPPSSSEEAEIQADNLVDQRIVEGAEDDVIQVNSALTGITIFFREIQFQFNSKLIN